MEKKRIKRMPTRSIFCDVDDTLIQWSSSKYFDKSKSIKLHFMNYEVEVSPNDSNIEAVKNFYRRGYEVIIWSATGKEWGELVAKQLGLEDYVDYYLSKPDFYIDDLSVENFMMPMQRLWYKPSGPQKD